MTLVVSPEEFNAAFLAVARRHRAAIEAAWWGSPKYTRLLLNDGDGVLLAVAKKLGLKYYQGCWGIDAVMYEKMDTDNFGTEGWPEQLTVVVEHENIVGGARGGAHNEINKMSIYNSPLKVLVTYPWTRTRHDRLKEYADILRRADVFKDFGTKRKHLVIFGLWLDDNVRWESYVYRLRKFVPLEVKP